MVERLCKNVPRGYNLICIDFHIVLKIKQKEKLKCIGKYLVLFILLQAVSQALTAQNVGNWTLNNTLTGVGTAFNTAGNVSAGSGISSTAFNGGTEWYGEGGWPTGALNTNAYIEFSLTPIAGYELNLSGLVLRIRRSNTGSPAGAGPLSWALRSSLDGFSADLATGSMTHNYANYPVTISSFIHISGTLTFRLYGYNATIPSGGISRLVIDNISVQGATALLPAKLSRLSAIQNQDGISFQWEVLGAGPASEIGLEASVDGLSFKPVKQWSEIAGFLARQYHCSVLQGEYQYFRAFVKEANLLKIYSNTLFISNKNREQLTLHSIYAEVSGLRIVIHSPAEEDVSFQIINSMGVRLSQGKLKLIKGEQQSRIAFLPSVHGVYYLSIGGITKSFLK